MRRPKKYESGEAAQYISRKQALKKLQLSLHDFRRLCIIKGVYPREPKHRRRAQKGASDIKILYHAKDIRFLLQEPIVWTLRDFKIFGKKTSRDRAVKDFRNLKRRLDMMPELKFDHIVKERYPTFIDCIKDLDDCLTLMFLFSTFPSLRLIPREQSALCRRLTIEFLHYVIASKSLRKVFISIKGYYFQAEIKGQKVTWIIPHYYPFKPTTKAEVDFKVMSIFVEFYSIMLGFTNFRLYNNLNLVYPPQFPGAITDHEDTFADESSYVSERICCLNFDLLKTDKTIVENEDDNLDIDYDLLEQEGDSKKVLKMKQEAQETNRLKNLFKKCKFFINREVPREPLVIIIRSFGGQVSWDKNSYSGGTYEEGDESITHHIVDRPTMDKQHFSRDYIQPQWVFDCVNQKTLLATSKYFMGCELPPHLSPFMDSKRDTYIPLEEKALRDPSLIETHEQSEAESDDEEEEEDETLNDQQLEKAFQAEQDQMSDEDEEEVNMEEDEDVDENEKKRKMEKKNMSVEAGKVQRVNKRAIKKAEVEEHRLKARMVKPRHRGLFRKLIREKQEKDKELWLMNKKRKNVDTEKKTKKREAKKEEKMQAAGF